VPKGFVVAIVGRPNVGKSTLVPRLLGERRAVIDDFPGVTRDRNYAEVAWNRRVFTLVDTGGYVSSPDEDITESVSQQVEIALAEAHVIVILVDVKTGPTDDDARMGKMVREGGKPYLLVVNKVDSEKDESDATRFYGLGLGDFDVVSAISGRKSGDLLDEIIGKLPSGEEETEEKEAMPKIAVVGRPNVGKSTLVNQLVGEERVVVSPIAGTTRDAIDLPVKRNGREFLLIDTAGLRRRSRKKEQVEYYSSIRTNASIERCDTAIVLVDGEEGCTLQDVKILGHAVDLGKGVILAINKWDLLEKDHMTSAEYTRELIGRFPSLRDYPIIFISALTGQRTWRVMDLALTVCDRRTTRIATGELNRFLEELNVTSPPPSKRGRVSKMYYCVQPKAEPPTVLFFTSRPKDVPEHYRRFLERQLREKYDLEGTPVRIVFKQK
jgi:GTP-binding protein